MVTAGARAPRILIVSFFYPPFSSIGGLRVSKMSKYLGELGWDVRVLTTDRDDVPADLALEIPVERVVRAHARDINAVPKLVLGRRRVRTHGFEMSGRFRPLHIAGAAYRELTNFPDGQIGWYRPAVSAGDTLIAGWRPDVVFSSALPATSHLVARRLAKKHGIPWAAEYRDPWTDSRSRRRIWPLRGLERVLEDRTVRDASAIVTVSDAWGAQLAARFPGAAIHVIPNGFDSADYQLDLEPRRDGPLSLLYTGRLYPRQDPRPLFLAIRTLLDAGTVDARDVRVRFVGRYLSSARDAASAFGLLGSVVEIEAPIAHHDALAEQRRAHALVMFLGADDDVGWRPAKLYEYLGARRPILMVGGSESHEARAVLAACSAGLAVSEASEIAGQIARWSAELRATGSVAFGGDERCIGAFERRALAVRLDSALRPLLA
jgi:glycosyltransferase involved in cell wall biosynthesis